MTKIEKIRINIQDKTAVMFSDAELQAFLDDSNDNANGATATALEIMALMAQDGLVKQFTRGDVTVSKTTVLELAKYYRDKYVTEMAEAKAAADEAVPACGFYIVPRGDGA